MALDSDILLYSLILANIVVYTLLFVGAKKARESSLPSVQTVEGAFRILEIGLDRAFPDLPKGYTWKEVMKRLKSLGIDMNWWEVENTLKRYEAYRYGGISYPNTDPRPIVKLATSLPKGEKYVRRS